MRVQHIGAARDHTNSAFTPYELGRERPARWPGRANDSDTFKGQSQRLLPDQSFLFGNQNDAWDGPFTTSSQFVKLQQVRQ
jgi:hypothetical protein